MILMAKLTREQKAYKQWADSRKPGPSLGRNIVVAYIVGGLICTLGQGVLNYFVSQGMSPKEAGGPTAAVMILLGAL